MIDGTATLKCPKCHATDGIDLDGGERLCFSCRYEWNPATEAATEAVTEPVAAPTRSLFGSVDEALHAATAADVLSITADDDEEAGVIEMGDRRPEVSPLDWVEKFVRTDLGVTIVVTDDDGGPILRGVDANGVPIEAVRASVIYLGDDPVGAGDLIVDGGGDEPLPQVMLAVAAACLTVAVESITNGDDGEPTITSPRIGWLPPPCDGVPEVEVGVAYACAVLILAFGLDREQVAKLAANLMTGASAGTETESEQ